MRRRAFTLTEVLVVIGLLLALASVVVPLAVTSARAGRVEDAGLQVEAAMAMARADAQRHSAPVRVMARTLSSGEVEVYAEAVALGAPREPESEWGSSSLEAEGPGVKPAEQRSLGTCVLPKGVVVCDRLETEGTSDGGPGPTVLGPASSLARSEADAASGEAHVGGQAEDGAVLLAVFMPDGEVLGPGPRYLMDVKGRVAEVRVDGLSGRVRVVTMRRPSGEAGAAAASSTGAENAGGGGGGAR